MPATREAHVPTLWDGALTDRGEGRGPGGRGQAGLGTPRPARAPECLATRPGTTGWMWHCRVVWAQAPRLARRLPKRLPWLGAPTSAAACGSRAGAARGSEPGGRQHRHRVQGTGIPRGRARRSQRGNTGLSHSTRRENPPFGALGIPLTDSTPMESGRLSQEHQHRWCHQLQRRAGGSGPRCCLRSGCGVPGGRGSRPVAPLPGRAMAPLRPLPQRSCSRRRGGRGRLASEPSCKGKFITSLEVLSGAESEHRSLPSCVLWPRGGGSGASPACWPLLPRSRALCPAPRPGGGCGEVPGSSANLESPITWGLSHAARAASPPGPFPEPSAGCGRCS